MELAENEFQKVSLYAGKDGIMGKREAEEGEFVTPQDKVIVIYEIGNVFVDVGVVERDIEKIKLNQKAKVYVDAYSNRIFEGNVENIFPVVEGKSRTLTVRFKVSNPDGLLLPGMFSRAEIVVAELQDAIIVPTTSIISTGKGVTMLPVISAQSIVKDEAGTEIGTVQLRRVNLGYITSDYVQITEGFNAGDYVVMETQGELKDGAQVKIVGKEELSF